MMSRRKFARIVALATTALSTIIALIAEHDELDSFSLISFVLAFGLVYCINFVWIYVVSYKPSYGSTTIEVEEKHTSYKEDNYYRESQQEDDDVIYVEERYEEE